MKKALSISVAAITALTSWGVSAFAEGADSVALASAITTAKSRVEIPEELSEFSYSVSDERNKAYLLTWSTPDNQEDYKYLNVVTRGNVVLGVYSSNTGWNGKRSEKLARLSGDELYTKAQAFVEQLNPTISKYLSVERDSINISMYNDIARFSVKRIKDGVEVQNDGGTIRLDKNTGELISFELTYHEKAAFRAADTAIDYNTAKEKYIEMIDIQPYYEVKRDSSTRKMIGRLVYKQMDYGAINAFTGNKSNFAADGYYGETDDTTEGEADNNVSGAGSIFTEAEQKELGKNLPYGSKDAVIKLLESDSYLTYDQSMELVSSELYKETIYSNDRYYYYACFSNADWYKEDYYFEEAIDEEYEYPQNNSVASSSENNNSYQNVTITVDAETGEIISYRYWDSGDKERTASYDLAKADKLAEEIAEKYAGEKTAEYRDYNSRSLEYKDKDKNVFYTGSTHTWSRYVNDIPVNRDNIVIEFNSDMKLTHYEISYYDVDFPDPAGMLTKEQIADKLWEDTDLDLYYLARYSDKKTTKTVLVYGTDYNLYADAFTGEPIYSYASQKNDLTGIKSKKLLKMAQALSDHNFIISTEKFSENDPVSAEIFCDLVGEYSDEITSEKLTRGEVIKIFVKSTVGDTVPALQGIFKSPFSDVKDTDPDIGYYAIAYAMGVVSGDKLNPDSDFTMGDMIKMVYTYYTTV